MRRWFKIWLSLTVIAAVTFLLDAMYAIQIDTYFGYGKIPFFGYYPNLSLIIVLIVLIMLTVAYVAFFLGAKPEIDNWLKRYS